MILYYCFFFFFLTWDWFHISYNGISFSFVVLFLFSCLNIVFIAYSLFFINLIILYSYTVIEQATSTNNVAVSATAAPAYSYDDLFPALPESATPKFSQAPNNNKMRIGSSVVTQVSDWFNCFLISLLIWSNILSLGFLRTICRTQVWIWQVRRRWIIEIMSSNHEGDWSSYWNL